MGVKNNTFGLEFLNDLEPVNFLWKTRAGNCKAGTREVGFIAQDLLALEEKYNASQLHTVLTANPEKLEISQGRLLPVYAKAIQELNEKIQDLQKQLNNK